MYEAYILQFRSRPLHTFEYEAQYLILGLDPSGGGQSSDYSIAMVGSDNCKIPIVGLDSSSSHKHNEIMFMLEQFILKARSYRTYRDAHIFLFIEANMSFISADMLATFLQNPRFGSVEAVSLDPKNKNRYGVWTGETEKERYADSMERALANGQLCYSSEMTGNAVTLPQNKMALEQQLGWFRREVLEPKNPAFGKNKVVFTGKSAGKKDDMVLALQIALYHLEKLKMTQRFIEMARMNGWRY